MNNYILWNTSVVIPTFEREKEIVWLVESLNLYNPDLKIIVVDTSNNINWVLNKLWRKINMRYAHMLNKGISFSRNTWLEYVNTDFTLCMDDDFIISKKTKLASFIKKFKDSNLDILWWEVNNVWSEKYDFHWKYFFLWITLIHFIWLWANIDWNMLKCDVMPNYFLSKTSSILEIWWWDELLRFAREHDDFFLNAKNNNLTVWYDPSFWVDHNDTLVKHYNIQDNTSSIKHFCDKWDVNSKIEVRLYSENWKKRLSIYRFMWKKRLELSKDEKKLY